ncbi:MAG TPA: hypothetical protein PKD99_07955 [Sphingopyxis sp.]|nr:hypothetical protein [Sphingopyxis sp.]HMP45023.1 hypothetical protein [Sphingopyxis sp.]HMQ20402.1 hypothetical protein [Sphingopyxis sp.]
MADTVTLPRKVQDVLDEIERINKKIEAQKKLGGDTTAVEVQLKEAMKGILIQLATEARHEIIALTEAAQRLNQGIREPRPDPNARNPDVPANEDIKRLEELEKERQRIREKLKHARRHAPPGEETDAEDQLDARLTAMDQRIRRAAREAARREMRDLNEEIDAIINGRPPRGAGNGPGAKPPDNKKDEGKDGGKEGEKPAGGGGGGGTGGGGGGGDPGTIDAGIQPGVPVGKIEKAVTEVPTIFVRNESSVWAWNARDLAWLEMDFGGELIDVQTIKGGILAFSATRAGLYDSYLGVWLPQLDVPGGVLSEASAKN